MSVGLAKDFGLATSDGLRLLSVLLLARMGEEAARIDSLGLLEGGAGWMGEVYVGKLARSDGMALVHGN